MINPRPASGGAGLGPAPPPDITPYTRYSQKGVHTMKDYQKPDVEFISLVAQEPITDDEFFDGEMGLESSIF